MDYRNLTANEVTELELQGCTAIDWNRVWVAPDFETQYVVSAHFSGDIRIGSLKGEFTLKGGISKHAGLRHVTMHNVTIGNGCYIKDVHNYIANYTIGDDTYIENVDSIVVDGKNRFGNGVEVSVLNETGGREVAISDKLSAQLAYIMAMYRHRPELAVRLREIADYYSNKHASEIGEIADHVTIMNVGSIMNVRIGSYASVIGANRLNNGSINSNKEAPVYVGHSVICDDFIISSGSTLDDGAMLTRCFVGQACTMGHGYSASDSLFFSNCQEENGEACAIFAGPFTVTHHKSTLLIAGMFSFMNAGSGSNQSNHMYKLGPIHQGILERGAKLPFSYLIEKKDTTYLVPGVNLRSVGTIRDAQKWPRRDKRSDPNKLDCINYNLLSPYTIQKMFKGCEILNDLRHASGELSDEYSFHSAKIRNSSLVNGIKFYEIGICKFLGNSVIKRLEGIEFKSDSEIRERLKPDTEIGKGEWVDISGLIAPKSEVDQLLDNIEKGIVNKLKEINGDFMRMHINYYTYEWTWAYEKMIEFFKLDPDTITALDIIRIVERWKDAVIGLDKMVYEDAKKEFSLSSMTGFGADGTKFEKEQDFEQVRGDFESNPFVTAVLDHIKVKTALGNELIERLKPLTVK